VEHEKGWKWGWRHGEIPNRSAAAGLRAGEFAAADRSGDVAPVVTSVFREVAPNYVVRDIFAIKREEFRAHATQIITERLSSDPSW